MPPPTKGTAATQIISAPIRCRVKTIYNDYLLCHMMTRDTEGTDIDYLVAKPYALQHVVSHYDGLTSLTTTDTQTVEASDGATTETWKVTPDYVEDGQIMIERVQDTEVTVGGNVLTYVDINESGRAWAVA